MGGSEGQRWMGALETHLNGCYDALLLAAQAAALFPAHGLQHSAANIVTAQAISSGLLKVPEGQRAELEQLVDQPQAPSPWPWHSHGGCCYATILPPLGLRRLRDAILLSTFGCAVPVLHLLKVCGCESAVQLHTVS